MRFFKDKNSASCQGAAADCGEEGGVDDEVGEDDEFQLEEEGHALTTDSIPNIVHSLACAEYMQNATGEGSKLAEMTAALHRLVPGLDLPTVGTGKSDPRWFTGRNTGVSEGHNNTVQNKLSTSPGKSSLPSELERCLPRLKSELQKFLHGCKDSTSFKKATRRMTAISKRVEGRQQQQQEYDAAQAQAAAKHAAQVREARKASKGHGNMGGTSNIAGAAAATTPAQEAAEEDDGEPVQWPPPAAQGPNTVYSTSRGRGSKPTKTDKQWQQQKRPMPDACRKDAPAKRMSMQVAPTPSLQQLPPAATAFLATLGGVLWWRYGAWW
jgi:hypothetical protein